MAKTTRANTAEATAAALTPAYESIPLAWLTESTTNPRKTWRKTAMDELVQSVRSVGIVQPILVRNRGPQAFEIVVGSRRYRAALEAELGQIPAIVRDLDDQQVLEIQIVENLIREDVHPLEEADGFRHLMSQPNYTAQTIADRVGKNVAYVYKRMALVNLIPELREDFIAEKIHVGHAQRLARLPEASQRHVLEHLLYEEGGSKFVPGQGYKYDRTVHAVTVAHLDDLIDAEILLDLAAAPWAKDDAELIPAAGACITCPKRSAANAQLFDDVRAGDHCLDRDCYAAKAEAHFIQIVQVKKDEGVELVRISHNYNPAKGENAIGRDTYAEVVANKKGKVKNCPDTEQAIYVDNPGKGTIIQVCRNQQCSLHHNYRPASHTSRTPEGKVDFWAQKEKKLGEKIETAARRQVLEDICNEPVNGKNYIWAVPHSQQQIIALALLKHMTPPELLDVFKFPGLEAGKRSSSDVTAELRRMILAEKGSPASDWLPKIIFGLALQDCAREQLYSAGDERKRFDMAANVFGIDHKNIENEIGMRMREVFKAARLKSQAKKAGKSPAEPAPKTPAVKTAAKHKAKPAKKAKATVRKVATAKKKASR